MADLSVVQGDPTSPAARALLGASHALMQRMFPREANHFLSVEALAAPHITFFLANRAGRSLGCAALANKGEYGEVKSMYVDENARGLGAGAALLAQLQQTARAQGLPRLMLETGVGLDAAHRLYERHGFVDCPAFGDYAADAPYSRYMELSL